MKMRNNLKTTGIIQRYCLKKLNTTVEANLTTEETDILFVRDQLISSLLSNLEEFIRYPLKEISILIRLIEINEKQENHILISELKDIIKTIFLNYNYITKSIKHIKYYTKNKDNF